MKKYQFPRICLLVMLLIFGIKSNAQKKVSTEYSDLYFYINDILEVRDDTVYATIPAGKKAGIKLNTTLKVYGSINVGIKSRENIEYGYAIVTAVGDYTSFVTIVRYDVTDKNSEIYVNDYVVAAEILIPPLPYHSMFFEMAKKNINFYIDKKPLYTFKGLLYYDSKGNEDSMITQCINSMHDVYEIIKDMEKYQYLRDTIPTGRYKGKSTMNLIKDPKPKDILAFMKYVNNYSISYTSNDWNFPDIFATWVMNKAPYSKIEIMDSVYYFKNKSLEQIRVIRENKALILKEEMVYYWAAGIPNFINNNQFDSANTILDIAIKIGTELKDSAGLVYCYFMKAQLYQDKENYTEAIKYCKKASALYLLLKDYSGLLNCELKEVYCLYADKKYKEAIVSDKKTLDDYNTYKDQLSSFNRNFLEPKIYYYLAINYYELFDFNAAMDNFQKAIAINNNLNTLDSRKKNITYYDMVATIYKKQGKSNEAIDAYGKLLKSYKDLGNREKIAYTYYSMASVYFNLGKFNDAIDYYNESYRGYYNLESYSNAGLARSGVAKSYQRLGKYDDAVTIFKEAIILRQYKNDYSGTAYTWTKLSDLYVEMGEKDKAVLALDSAVSYYVTAKDSSGLYDIYTSYGEMYTKEKNEMKAFEKYNSAYDMSVKSNNRINQIESSYNMATVAYSYDTAASRKYFTICNNLAKEMGDVSNQIYSLLNLANLASLNFQYVDSKNKIDNALLIANKNANIREIAVCYNYMARIFTNELNIEKSTEYYLKSIHIFDSIGEVTQLSRLYSNVGSNYVTRGDFIKADLYFNKSLEVARKNNNVLDQSDAFNSISYQYNLTGDFHNALIYADSSISLVKDLQNSAYIANCYLTKGGIYQHTSEYKLANYYYTMADSIYVKDNNLLGRSVSQNNIGTLYYWQADFDGCYPYIKTAYDIHEKIKLHNESWILYGLNLGEIFLVKKDYPNSLKYLMPSYTISKEKKLNRMASEAALVLGHLEYDRKNYTQALTYLNESSQYGNLSNEREKTIEAALYLGRTYMKLNNTAKGVEYLQKCVDESARYNIVKYNWEALYDLGTFFFERQKFDSSVIYYKQAIKIIEENSSNVFDDEKVRSKYSNDSRKVDLYSKIIASFIELHDTTAALEFANKSNIQGMKDQISRGGLVIDDPKKAEALKRAQELELQSKTLKENLSNEKAKPVAEQNQEVISSYERSILTVEADYVNYIDSLVTTYPDLKDNFVTHTNPKDFESYQENIPQDVAVVLYMMNDDNLFIFTVTNQSKKVSVVRIKQKELETKIKNFQGLLNVPDKSAGAHTLKLRGGELLEEPVQTGLTLLGTSKDLYKILIDPIAADIKGKTKICIIPNGKLCNIPFQVLGNGTNPTDFRFLVEDYSIFYITKLDIFLRNSRGNDSLNSMAAFGNPDYNHTQKELPSAEREVKDIQKMLVNGDYYYGKAATELQAKQSLQSKHFIHFATHGILDNSNFKNSYIKFTSDASDDGNLSISEIKGLKKLSCDMVVLSACETAVTTDSIKGWYYSAANSFLEKGVKTVIASLWSVDDDATGILMTEFYKNLKTMPKAEALRAAQATLSKNPKYIHPFFWGAFVLYGDWR